MVNGDPEYQMRPIARTLRACERVALALEAHPACFHILLGLVYVVQGLPNVLVIKSIYTITYPLNFAYMTKLLFAGNAPNPAIASTVVTPSNASLIYPMGFFLLTKMLGGISSILLFAFLIQGIVPLMSFILYGSVVPRSVAFILAILTAKYAVTNALGFRPDNVIQPVMLIALAALCVGNTKDRISLRRVVIVGILTSMIILLKHNIGIFFTILCATVIFFQCFQCEPGKRRDASYLVYAVIVGYFTLGCVILTRLPHADEMVYFLSTFFVFWVALFAFYHYNPAIRFDSMAYLKRVSLYGSIALLLPISGFVWYGSVLGYGKYWYALFGMGFDFLQFWDYGIIGIIKSYSRWGTTLYFALPFLANLAVCAAVFRLLLHGRVDGEKVLAHFRIGSVSIIGILMFFPLEDILIATTKTFIGVFVCLWILKASLFSRETLEPKAACGTGLLWKRSIQGVLRPGVSADAAFMAIALAMCIGQFVLFFPRLSTAASIPRSYGSREVQSVVGRPMQVDFADELSDQVKTIARATRQNPYCIIENTGGTLMGLAAIVDNRFPQYYMRFDKGLLNREVTRSVISAIREVPYIVVQTTLYEEYLSGHHTDAGMTQLLDHVTENYVVIDKYDAPRQQNQHTLDLYGFVVMKKR